jgi:translation initiation factor 1A
MVKNKIGGKRTKRGARKNLNDISSMSRKIRFIEEEGEEYAIVNKIIGNGQCNVMCGDGKLRLCFIRNKFSGRNKHSNLVNNGTWIMIGKRDWETTKKDKLEKCDLLELYSDDEKNRLKQETNYDFTLLIKEENKLNNINDEEESDTIFFENNVITCYDSPQEFSGKEEDIEINFDDI